VTPENEPQGESHEQQVKSLEWEALGVFGFHARTVSGAWYDHGRESE